MKIDFKEECTIDLYISNINGKEGNDSFYISFYIGDCDHPSEIDEFITEKMKSFTSNKDTKFKKIDESEQGDDFSFAEMDDTITFKIRHIKSITKEVFDFLKSFIDIPVLINAFKHILYYHIGLFHSCRDLENTLESIKFLQNEFNNSLTEEERLSIKS